MTNFIDGSINSSKKILVETEFTHMVSSQKEIVNVENQMFTWKNIKWLGKDNAYGDMFQCWDGDPDNFAILFGIKGDEFNK